MSRRDLAADPEMCEEAIRRAMAAEARATELEAERDALGRRVAELEMAIREECADCPRDGKGLSGKCLNGWCPLYPYRPRWAQIEESQVEGCGEEE